MRLAIAAAAVLALAGSAAAQTTHKLEPGDEITAVTGPGGTAADGDTILLAKGRYYENVVVGKPNLRIIGKGAILDGNIDSTDGVCLEINVPGVTVKGIAFRNGTQGIDCTGSNLTVQKCTFSNHSGYGITVESTSGLDVTGCRFRGTGSAAIQADTAAVAITKCTARSPGANAFEVNGANARIQGNTISFVQSGSGVVLDGSGVVVNKNKLFNIRDAGLFVIGNLAMVGGNTLRAVDGGGIWLDGTDATVEKNNISDVGSGIYASGDGARVLSNKVSDVHGYYEAGIQVNADDMTIVGNTVTIGSRHCYGFYLYGKSPAGDGIVQKNKASDMIDAGFYVSTDNVSVSDCSAKGCGYAGFDVGGSGNTFDRLVVVNTDNLGIYVENGVGNIFSACSVKDVVGDGYRVDADGDANTFTDCTAADCGADGFDNRGTSTTLTGGKYRGDRFDVTNAPLASFTDVFLTGVNFVTGGSGTSSQVD